MKEPTSNLDQVLRQLASEPVVIDPRHRYALRRALLHSQTFTSNRIVTRWFQVLSVTGSALAGSLVVAVVVVSVSVVRPGSVGGTGSVQVVESELLLADNEVELVHNEVLPRVQTVDFSEFVTKASVDKWIVAPETFTASY